MKRFKRNTLNVTKTMQDFILHLPRESENVQNLDLRERERDFIYLQYE